MLKYFKWKFLQVIAKIDGKHKFALEGTWVPGVDLKFTTWGKGS